MVKSRDDIQMKPYVPKERQVLVKIAEADRTWLGEMAKLWDVSVPVAMIRVREMAELYMADARKK